MKELSHSPEDVKKIFCRGEGDTVKKIIVEPIQPEIHEKKIITAKESLKFNELKKTKHSVNLVENHFWVTSFFIQLGIFLFIVTMLFLIETESCYQIYDAVKNVWCKKPIIEEPIVTKTYFEKFIFYCLQCMKKCIII